MSHSAHSVENLGTITNACSSSEISAPERPELAHPPKSGSVQEISRKPRLATNADGSAPNGKGLIQLELPPDIADETCPSPAPSLALPDAQIASVCVVSVLIVDDVAMNRDIAGSILQAAGYKVTSVACGADAIAAVKMTEFDVILMDVRMPGMDGLEATRHIRALEGRRGLVPVVALTGQDFPEQIEECRKAGMDGHVSKPFDPDKLAAAVARATRVGSAKRAAREPAFITVSTVDPRARRIGTELRAGQSGENFTRR